jgi:hypothetical protein
MHEKYLTKGIRQCIQNCLDCYKICLETAMHCLSLGAKHSEASHIRRLMECANICHTSANFMLLGSEFHSRTCEICAEICERCAEDCEKLDASDSQMKACAEMCRRCADSCREMSGIRKAA